MSNKKFYSIYHLGLVRTEISRNNSFFHNLIKVISLTPELGCQTILYCALDDQISNESGHYYYNCTKCVNDTFAVTNYITNHSCDDSAAQRLWNLSCELVKLNPKLFVEH